MALISPESSPYVYTVAAALFALVLLRVNSRRRRLPYPPGPKGLPVIGNIRDISAGYEWLTYAKWGQEYDSDVIHLNLAGTHLLVVNSYEAAFELFERRSAIYNDKPRLPMIVELSGWEWSFSFLSYGPKWRSYRKLFHRFFNSGAVAQFQPQEYKATHELLHKLIEKPENYVDHIRLMAGSLILNVAYGIEVQSVHHPFMETIEKSMECLVEAGNPGSFLVDSIPSLKYVPEWVPGAGFKRKARQWRAAVRKTIEVPYKIVQDEMTKGTQRPSVTSLALQSMAEDPKFNHSEDEIRGVSAVSYTAGSDTTTSVLQSFFLAMLLNPDIAKKAQKELDLVVGRYRLPEFKDKEFLPYVSALVNEVLRWNPVTPAGVPHRLMVDDVYNGYFMPAGSIVLGNTWAVLHDEKAYPNPEKFNPERFLKDGKINPDVRKPEAAFGFGRRICPGRHLALSSIFINIACILSAFDITNAVDENGKLIIPEVKYTTGSTSHPEPFKCSIKPRSENSYRLVTEAYATHHP